MQANQHTAILANRRYHDKQTEDQREAAIKAAAAAGGDTKRLTMPLDERMEIARKAEEAKNAAKKRLSPQTVEQIAVMKVENMVSQAARELREAMPGNVRMATPKERKVVPVPGEPHCAIGQVATIDAGRGRFIAIYGGNARGEIELDDNGMPRFSPGKIIPSTEETQNKADYFALVAAKGPDGKPAFSKHALFRLTDINDVAAACCRLLQIPEPEKKIEKKAEQKAEIDLKAAAPARGAWRDQAPQAPKPSKWGEAMPDNLTIAERRAMVANSAHSYSPEHRQPVSAYAR